MSDDTRHFCDWLHTGWGDRVAVHWPADPGTAEHIDCDGHLRGFRKGDVILIRFHSGKVGQLPVEEIEYERDPNDMFFAKLGWGDYAPWGVEECEAKDWTRQGRPRLG